MDSFRACTLPALPPASSPLDVPLLEQEPLLGLDAEDMQVLVEAPDDKYLLVVAHGLGAEELLRLLEAALVHPQDHVGLRVEVEAVADPAVIAAEDQDL